MAYVKVLRCDECGSQKDQVNHWFALGTSGNVDDVAALAAYKLSDLSEEDAEEMKHYCGQHCAGKAFHRWLDTGSIEKPATTHDPDPDFNSSATLIEEKA